MRFISSVFSRLLEPIGRRQFNSIVERHSGDAYGKSFGSWDHLIALIYAQLGDIDSLRDLEAGWNAIAQHHYHLGSGRLARSTLSDAGMRRPVEVFAQAFGLVASQLDRQTRREGKEMLRLVDSTPVPLGKLCGWAKSNGRTRGLKMHVVYDPKADCPRILDVTPANVNDVDVGRTIAIEAGATYVFDKGYCDCRWWSAIAAKSACFVTRPKKNAPFRLVETRPLADAQGDGFSVVCDDEVKLASQSGAKLPIRLRRVIVLREKDNKAITLLTNDFARPASAIGALYKGRWDIELLFRWLKQNLKIRKFLGHSANAIRLQLYAAMIAFALLRIAAKAHAIALPRIRFINLAGQLLFERRKIQTIEKPPPVNPSRRNDKTCPNQLQLNYA